MRLATIRIDGTTRAVRGEGDLAIELDAPDVGAVLARADWREWAGAADGPVHAVDTLDFAPVITHPDKIICVGLNYRNHIVETGREVPDHPTLFAKFRSTLIGANDDIVLPRVSRDVDWEAELGVIIGARIRHADEATAAEAIAGYSVVNDVSVRDYQYRTLQWLQGKMFEHTTPLGPWLVTTDETPGPGRMISCDVNGERMQEADTADLVFDPVTLIAYISSIITLEPGDVIATGTPGGVGAARQPPRFLTAGDEVVTRIEGVGECRNVCRAE
jgi:acylpyruvate hydrolase